MNCSRIYSRIFLLVVMAMAVGLIAGCGSSGDDTTSGATSSAGAGTTEDEPIKVALVADGPLDDHSLNQVANEGREAAEEELGAETRVVSSTSSADYLPNLTQFAQEDYDLVIGLGFEMAEAVDTAATEFPDTKFAIVDYPATALKSLPKNVEGLIWNEEEGGYLAGYVAGLYAKDQGAKAVSSVGGEKIPPVDNYIVGFQAGAKAAYPGVETLNGYSQDFVDQAKCKEIALNQIAAGSVAVIQLAGGCGLGALDAAKQEGVQGVGESSDQSFLGDHILTSALKKVDVAIVDEVKRLMEGKFLGGQDVLGTVKNDAIGLGTFNKEGSKYEAQAKELEEKMAAGEVDVPENG